MDSESMAEMDGHKSGELQSSKLADPRVLFVAAACVVLGALLAAAPGVGWHVVGYALACLVTFTLVALFRRYSTQKMAAEGIVAPAWTKWFSIALLIVGFVAAIINAWAIADKLS